MKVLIVSPYISTSKSLKFYQSQQLNLSKELVRLGLNVSIVTSKRYENEEDNIKIDGVDVDFLDVYKFFPEKRFNQPVMKRLWKYLKNSDCDIFQTSEFHSISTLVVTFFCFFYKKKMIIYQGIYKNSTNTVTKIFTRFWDFSFSFIISKVCCVSICKTNAAAEYLKERGIKKTVVIPVGVNTQIFNSINTKRELNKTLQLLMVGNLIPLKNHLFTLKALQLIKKEGINFNLTIIGRGNLYSQIESEIKTLNIHNNVVLIDKVPNTEMKNYYVNSDFTLMFSSTEIFGMTMLEAMACGSPFLTNFMPGAIDCIVDGKNGYKLKYNHFKDLFKELEKVFKAPTLDRVKIEKTTIKNFSWKNIAKIYSQLYTEL